MRVINHTPLDTSYLRRLASVTKPERCTGVEVTFKNAPRLCHIAGRGGSRVLIHIPKVWGSFPFTYINQGAYLGISVYTKEEELVHVLAHEWRHVWQRIVPRGWRVWGSKGQFSERDADAYGLQILRQYRRGELKI